MLERGKCIFVGVDVHKATHTAVIVDPWGEMIGKAITFNNNPTTFPAFVDTVSAFNEEDKTIVFGLEDVGGYGRSLAVFLSRQGNRKLNSLFYELAVQQVQFAKGKEKKARNPVMRAYYERKIEEGKSKGQALICVMRVLVRVIYGMMKNKTAYQQPEIYEKQAV